MTEAADQARRAITEKGFAGAKPLVAGLCVEHPDDDTLRAFRAVTLIWTGDYEGAQQTLSGKDQSAAILGVRAELHSILGETEAAKETLARAQAIDPDDYLVLRAANSAAGLVKDFAGARKILARSLELYPDDPDVYAGEVTAFQSEGNVAGLKAFLDGSPDWFKKTAQYCACRGRLAFSQHDVAAMEVCFQEAVAMSPESGSYWAYLAEAQWHQAKYQEAERSAQFATDLNPKSPLALRVLAKVANARGDKVAAAEFQRRAAEAFPILKASAKTFQAPALLRRGDVDGALRIYREQVKTDNPIGAATARRIILGLLIRHKRLRDAREQLEEILRLGDDHPTVKMHGFQLRYLEGSRAEAVEGMRKMALEADPQAEFYAAALGMFLDAGANEDADRLVERLKTSPPGNASALGECIMILDKAGRKAEARAMHEAASRMFPNVPSLKILAAGFAAKDGDGRRALRLISELPPGQRPRLRIPFKVFWKVLMRRWFGKRRR